MNGCRRRLPAPPFLRPCCPLELLAECPLDVRNPARHRLVSVRHEIVAYFHVAVAGKEFVMLAATADDLALAGRLVRSNGAVFLYVGPDLRGVAQDIERRRKT